MPDREKVIKELMKLHGSKETMNIIFDAIVLLREREESIPVSWLAEKLEGHPEIPYAVKDGISNVLTMWERRRSGNERES